MAKAKIEAYDPAWVATYEALASDLRATLGDEILRIDHIGSTSVPGLAAKAVVDIQVTVADLAVADRWPDRLGPFARRPGVGADHVPPGARPGDAWAKRYWSARDPAAHLHVRAAGRPNTRYAVLFRDHLRADAATAAAYEQAKRVLATLCPDKASYAEAKDPVCDLVMASAERWADATGWAL